MTEEPMFPGRSYLLKIGCRTVRANVTELKHRLDVETLAKHAAKTLSANEIGLCNVATSSPVPFDTYAENRATGSFILIDRFTNATAAAGMIQFALRRATTIHFHQNAVSKEARAAIKHQRPAVLWFTGLSGSGKSTIANLVESRLHARGAHTILLDGDNVRSGLNRDLGYTEADRVENIRRVAEVAKLMTEAGLIVLTSFISPFRAEREMARELFKSNFLEIFVDTSLEECIARDPKGLYKRAIEGKLMNFTGIGQPYEKPESPELRLGSTGQTAEEAAELVIRELLAREFI
jgi:bifunctional enzyme CysN/CysC